MGVYVYNLLRRCPVPTSDERMIRSQILLTPEQRRRLEALAEEEGRSISDVARRAIDAGLAAMASGGSSARRRGLAVLEALTAIRLEMQERVGEYAGDPVAEARESRERDSERVWKGE